MLTYLTFNGHTITYAMFGLSMTFIGYISLAYILLLFNHATYLKLGHIGINCTKFETNIIIPKIDHININENENENGHQNQSNLNEEINENSNENINENINIVNEKQNQSEIKNENIKKNENENENENVLES